MMWIFVLLTLIILGLTQAALMPQYNVVATHIGFMIAVPLLVILLLGRWNEKPRTQKAKR